MFAIRQDDLSSVQTRELLALHVGDLHQKSPPGTTYALDLTGLSGPSVTVWSAWAGERIAGMGALALLAPDHAEVKSMRTHPDFLRQGVAAMLLETIIAAATARGVTKLSLETGVGAAFEPALALYRRRGFRNGEIFGDYRPSPFNQFLHLQL